MSKSKEWDAKTPMERLAVIYGLMIFTALFLPFYTTDKAQTTIGWDSLHVQWVLVFLPVLGLCYVGYKYVGYSIIGFDDPKDLERMAQATKPPSLNIGAPLSVLALLSIVFLFNEEGFVASTDGNSYRELLAQALRGRNIGLAWGAYVYLGLWLFASLSTMSVNDELEKWHEHLKRTYGYS